MSSKNDQPPETDAQPAEGLGKMLSELSSGMERLITETMESLAARGIDAYDLAPLMKLRDTVRALEDVAATKAVQAPESAHAPVTVPDEAPQELKGGYDRDGRRGEIKASDNLLARASAIIDIMVQGGDDPEHAAQIITRQLLGVGIKLPETGGDARAWKRMYNWRSNLIHYKRAGPAWDTYCAFKEELASIPPDQRLRIAIGERLWDRRQDLLTDRETA